MKTLFPSSHRQKLLTAAVAVACWLGPSGGLLGGVVADFNDGIANWDYATPAITATLANGALSITRTAEPSPGCPFGPPGGLTWYRPVALIDGQTLSLRVDLLELEGENADVTLDYQDADQGGYSLNVQRDSLWMGKFRPGGCGGCGCPHFFNTNIALPTEELTFEMALTRIGAHVSITVRIFDRANSSAVLFEQTALDGPGADPTAPSFEGISLPPDWGAPFTDGDWIVLQLRGRTDAGTENLGVAFDNLRYEFQNAAVLKVQGVVEDMDRLLLSWPAFDTRFELESKFTLDGLWSPVSESAVVSNTMIWTAVPLSTNMQLFRLRGTP